MVFITCMTGQPEDEVVYAFATSEDYGDWSFGVSTIKCRILSINNDGNAGAPRVPHYRTWLALVDAFVLMWGVDLVPLDIRRAVNDVEGNIGVPLTVWDDSRA